MPLGQRWKSTQLVPYGNPEIIKLNVFDLDSQTFLYSKLRYVGNQWHTAKSNQPLKTSVSRDEQHQERLNNKDKTENHKQKMPVQLVKTGWEAF